MTNDRIDAIVFDLDGTLIDSAPDLRAALNVFLVTQGRSEIDLATVHRMIGDGSTVFVRQAMEMTGDPADETELPAMVRAYLDIYEANVAVLTEPYDGVLDTLAAIKKAGYRTGVCTNKPQAAALGVLDALGLAPDIDAVGGGDHYPERKPHPGHLLGLLNDLGVDPGRTIMVGDNEHDAAAAEGAGAEFVLMSYGYARKPLDQIPAAARLDRFTDLPDVIARLDRSPSS